MSIHAIHRDPPPWTFGDRLRKVRRSLPGRVTQEQFAEHLGYPPKRYEQWEADRNLPGSQTVPGRFMRCPIDRLRHGTAAPVTYTNGVI